MKKNLIVN